MISSMDLFFRRDCAGGAGPAVDVPRVVFVTPALFDVLVVAACAVGCETVDGAVDEVLPSNKFGVGMGAEDVDGPVVPLVTVGWLKEFVVLEADWLALEKMPPPTRERRVCGASLLAPSAPNGFGAVAGACEESVDMNEQASED